MVDPIIRADVLNIRPAECKSDLDHSSADARKKVPHPGCNTRAGRQRFSVAGAALSQTIKANRSGCNLAFRASAPSFPSPRKAVADTGPIG